MTKQMIDPKAGSSNHFPSLCQVMFHVHISEWVPMGALHLPASLRASQISETLRMLKDIRSATEGKVF